MRETDPATSIEVRLLGDFSRELGPKQIASVLVGLRTIDRCEETSCEEKKHAPLETAKSARKRCGGKEKKKLCIVSILLLVDTARGYNLSNRGDTDCEKIETQDRALGNSIKVTIRWERK